MHSDSLRKRELCGRSGAKLLWLWAEGGAATGRSGCAHPLAHSLGEGRERNGKESEGREGSFWGPSVCRRRWAVHQQPCGSDPLGLMAGSRSQAGCVECPDECQREAELSPCLLRGQRLLAALDKGWLLNFVLLLLLKLHINLVLYLASF